MPDPTRLLHTLRQAARAFRDTPGRRGRLVVLDGAADVLVAGDLHGNVENFRLLLKKADLGNHPRRHFVVQELIHGPHTYPGGGDRSHQLVDLTAALKCQYPGRVHYLLGNHELAQATNRRIAKAEGELNSLFRQGVETAYGPFAEEVYAVYLDLISRIPLAVRTPNRVFVSHSLPSGIRVGNFDPAVLERDTTAETDVVTGGPVYSLLWGRDTSDATAAAFLRKVDADLLVSGHVPSDRGFEVPNGRQVIVDCVGSPGCYCLFPTDRPLTHAELVGCVGVL
jgi:hypothetical protein